MLKIVSICSKYTTVHHKDPVKPINVDGPNKRYEFDITNLNDDLFT